MTQLRPHSDSVEESIRQCVELLTGDIADVMAYIQCNYPQWRPERHKLVQIHCGYHSRTGWDTWLIKLGSHPVAWTDGPIAGMARVDVVGGRTVVLSSP